MVKKKQNLKNELLRTDSNSGHRLLDIRDLNYKERINRSRDFCRKYRVGDGDNFQLKKCATKPDIHLNSEDKNEIGQTLQIGIETLATLQDTLYAQDKWSVLLIFQAMDAAGKDGAIKHVMSGINPQGCQVISFKAPSAEELDHDFLWRCLRNLPERGRIGIFNRSYYEEVLVVRVHEEILAAEKLPEELVSKKIWEKRFKDIRNFEKYLHRNGTVILKFFLHVSKDEQKKRFLERIDNPEKNWKFSVADIHERKFWNDYMHAYEDMIRETSTDKCSWYVVPADNKAFARIVIASAIISALDELGLKYPKLSTEKIDELKKIRKQLEDS